MAFCEKCGAELEEGTKFCQACGAEVTGNVGNSTVNSAINDFTNTPDSTSEYDEKDINDNKVMGVLSYIGILWLVPLLAAKDSKFAKFHANQGLVLWLASIILSVASAVLAIIPIVGCVAAILLPVVGIGGFVLMILGIINAAQGKAKELPIIGKYRILK